jgi:hypothetical protein
MNLDEIRILGGEEKRRVLEQVELKGFTCGGCGSGDFEVGEALYLGFLFVGEQHGSYMVGLTCENPGCETPRIGIRLRESDFSSGT